MVMNKKIITKSLVVIVTILLPFVLYLKLTKSNTKIHVLMPVYNSASYIGPTVQSVVNQTHGKDVTLILYNDGSTDDSIDIAKKILTAQDNINYKVYENSNTSGIANARITLLRLSKEINPHAHLLWLDSDDQYSDPQFIAKFMNLMNDSGADAVLFNFDVKYEDPAQIANAKGLLQDKKISETVLDSIAQAPGQVLETADIDNILNFTSLGWTKGYKKGFELPTPEKMANYEDFVYMAALLRAKKIAAMPSSYKPITYLRRAHSITGQRTAKSFFDVLKQLEKFIAVVPEKEREKYKNQINDFVKRKIDQYRAILKTLVGSADHNDITPEVLDLYNKKASEILG